MQQTATELWGEWVRSGVLKPGSYDADVKQCVQGALEHAGAPAAGTLEAAMDAVEWTPRDLIRALAPVVASFTGMLRDLLRLLSRIGAKSGTRENLRVVYEFDKGDLIDDSLGSFRETVERLESVVVRTRPLVFDPDRVWQSPLRGFRAYDLNSFLSTHGWSVGREHWQFGDGVPVPELTGSSRVDGLLEEYVRLLRCVAERLGEIGDDTIAVTAWLVHAERDEAWASGSEIVAENTSDIVIAREASDYWLLSNASMACGFAEAVARGEPVRDDLLDRLEAWLAEFWGVETDSMRERLVEEFTDVLSLPTWGRRHDLYSAWIATQIDRALDSRLEFVVEDGALRFPFSETLLARLDAAAGDVELRSERKFPASDLVGKGRKNGVQPDYSFVRASDQTPIVAVEVKQYRHSTTSKPAAALRDYVVALSSEQVFLVAHGPLGRGVARTIPAEASERAHVHRNVRVGKPAESAAFRKDLASLFPPPPKPTLPGVGAPRSLPGPIGRPVRVELRWLPSVHDLDLHILGRAGEMSYQNPLMPHAVLKDDTFNGGPEIAYLSAVPVGIEVRVHVYSQGTLRAAAPVAALVWDDGARMELVPTDEVLDAGRRCWVVGSIDEDGTVTPSGDSRIADL
ncbi:hypothetical protein GCM10027059_30400 [Myceligenerans halotolerans]